MTTTFQSRELVRDELVTLFTTDDSWQAVYGYYPGDSVIAGRSPLLVILPAGTQQLFDGLFTNPTTYRFEIRNFIVSSSESDATVLTSASIDQLDTLDQTIRQVIRDNVQLTNADNLRFDENFSTIQYGKIMNKPYIRETFVILADLPSGST